MAKVATKIESTERESEIVKEMTGKDIQSCGSEVEIPVELSELAALVMQALPLIKAYIGKIETTKVALSVNGEVVQP